jgi:hypothetical protein
VGEAAIIGVYKQGELAQMKPLKSMREALDSYRQKQEGTGKPLEKDAGGLGATRDSYEEKKRRRVPMPDEKKYNNY